MVRILRLSTDFVKKRINVKAQECGAIKTEIVIAGAKRYCRRAGLQQRPFL